MANNKNAKTEENTTPEETTTPTEDIIEYEVDLPETDNPVIIAMAEKVNKFLDVMIENRDIVKSNTISHDTVRENFRTNSKNEEILSLRDSWNGNEEEIKRLQGLIKELHDKNTTILTNGLKKSREELENRADTDKLKNAEELAKKAHIDITKSLTGMSAFADEDDQSTTQFMNEVRRRLPITSNVATVRGKKNPHSTQIREWAEREAIDINTRGRIPGYVVDKFYSANPDVTRPEGF